MTTLSIVIPTYERGEILLATLEMLLTQDRLADEVIVVDQTDYKASDPVAQKLAELDLGKRIIWLRLTKPSIPHAMNIGLKTATSDTVLFLDDDISIGAGFVQAHLDAINEHECPAQVGCVLQPNENVVTRCANYVSDTGLLEDLNFQFNSDEPTLIRNCMAGNLLVRRDVALACGGFDENFDGAAYRFETEFCRRLSNFTGKRFYYAPAAKIDHLRVERGGTRQLADHLTSITPVHSSGDFYFAFRCGSIREALLYSTKRLFQSFVARFYLSKPWYLPVRAIAETRGLLKALRLIKRGPRLLNN